MRDSTIAGKSVRFKSFTISKIVDLALMKTVEQLHIIKKIYLARKKPKIKHSTLCNSYENGDLNDVDIFYKITSLQCSGMKRLFDDNFHDWKVISLFLIKKSSEKILNFIVILILLNVHSTIFLVL